MSIRLLNRFGSPEPSYKIDKWSIEKGVVKRNNEPYLDVVKYLHG